MSKLIYTVKERNDKGVTTQTYAGFGGAYIRTMAHPRVLAAITCGGEVDFYRLDPDHIDLAVEELKRLYRSFEGQEVRVAIFRRENIVEPDGEPSESEEARDDR